MATIDLNEKELSYIRVALLSRCATLEGFIRDEFPEAAFNDETRAASIYWGSEWTRSNDLYWKLANIDANRLLEESAKL